MGKNSCQKSEDIFVEFTTFGQQIQFWGPNFGWMAFGFEWIAYFRMLTGLSGAVTKSVQCWSFCCLRLNMKWISHFLDNYVLATNTSGSYVLFSTVQKENGPRSFYPYFGLAYMGKNSLIRISVLKNSLYQVRLIS